MESTKESLLSSGVITYLWVAGLSLWGGMVSYLESREPFSWLRLSAHLLSSSFAGLMTFYLCQYGQVPDPLVGVLCGVAAHMGTPALLKMKIIRQFLSKDEDGKS
jgi:hypothetical protein